MSNIKIPEKMGEFFNVRANGYDGHMKDNVGSFDEFYDMVSTPINTTNEKIEILDLGCGTGLELKAIFKSTPNAMITGVDLSNEMLEKLKSKYDNFSDQITLINDSYTSHKFEKQRYDYAVSVMTVHHLLRDEKLELYKNIRNAIKDGGKYIEGDYVVSDEEEKEMIQEYEEKMKLVDKSELYHIDIPMSEENQIKLFYEAGFSKVEIVFEAEYNRIFVATV